MAHTITRFSPNLTLHMAFLMLIAGGAAGFGIGLASARTFKAPAPAPVASAYTAPDVCELPPFNPDGIGFLIQQDDARRRGTNV